MFSNPIYRFVCWLIICSVICSLVGVAYNRTAQIDSNSAQVKGVVTDVYVEPFNGDISSETYHTIEYSYKGDNFSDQSITCDYCDVGDTVDLIVNKNNPKQSRLETDLNTFEALLFLIGSIAASLVFCSWNFIRYRRWKKR